MDSTRSTSALVYRVSCADSNKYRSRQGCSSTQYFKGNLVFMCSRPQSSARDFWRYTKVLRLQLSDGLQWTRLVDNLPATHFSTLLLQVLLGSLHSYRLFLLHNGMTEDPTGTGSRLTLLAHGTAGLFAGLTRYIVSYVETRSSSRTCS
jgi:hypothetical protein